MVKQYAMPRHCEDLTPHNADGGVAARKHPRKRRKRTSQLPQLIAQEARYDFPKPPAALQRLLSSKGHHSALCLRSCLHSAWLPKCCPRVERHNSKPKHKITVGRKLVHLLWSITAYPLRMGGHSRGPRPGRPVVSLESFGVETWQYCVRIQYLGVPN